jgi:xylulose-5-phosphate/fructose-6-phosphate phosphoketolase
VQYDRSREQWPPQPELLAKMNAYWRAANYLSVGQIYLKDNPLLERPLTLDDVKPRLLGHWGTTPGLNFLYVHWNRLIRERDLNMMYIIGPGHGGPGLVANTYLEGSYTEIYPHIEQNADGIKRLFRQFSWPYGIPSHVAPETPGSIHEGGELGYSLVHAYGAAFDNPNLIVACVVGDGEAETGPLATSWHSNKFLNPATDGAVLPILHLNGYKIANPTVLARIPHAELESLMRGYGYEPFTLEGDDPLDHASAGGGVFDKIFDRIAEIQKSAREAAKGPHRASGVADADHAHPQGLDRTKICRRQAGRGHLARASGSLQSCVEKPEHMRLLEEWMRSYKPEELFDEKGAFRAELAEIAPKGRRRMGMNAHANGGLLLEAAEDAQLPRFCGQDRRPRPKGRRIHARSGATAARRHGGQQGAEKLPRLRAG